MNVEKRWGFGTVVRVDPAKNHLIHPGDPRRWMIVTVARTDRMNPWKLLFLGPGDSSIVGTISNWPHMGGFMRVDDDV